ncbi:MAG: rod shape-determining protein MreC [Opitutaceae bacterium]|nr:rod shape-determining protein MreC [Opitutaceae bacterium]|tara:strand:+ start:1808 stop:2599 length:792 start_codon:yes stop_codon:yes gene_type:complete
MGLVLLIWITVPTFFKKLTEDFFYEFQAPAWIGGSFVRDVQKFWTGRLENKKALIEEGRDLARLNASLQFQVQELDTLSAQVDRLESLFNLPSLPSYESEVGRIARRDTNGWWQEITIRKGRNYNISEGAPVVFSDGIVGKIREVKLTTSIIDLITSPNMRLAAVFEGDKRPVLYQGTISGPFTSPRGRVEKVPTDIQINREHPRRLVTSGLGGVFPAGLTIGFVRRLDASSDGLFQSGDVELSEDLNLLREVAVLRKLETDG